MPIEQVAESPARTNDDRGAQHTFTVIMRSTFGNAVMVVPGFPTRDAAQRAINVASKDPRFDEWGHERESYSDSAAKHVPPWTDGTILPVPQRARG